MSCDALNLIYAIDIGANEKGELLKVFWPTRDPLLFQKIPCHLVALLKDSATFDVLFQFGSILLCVFFTCHRSTCMYNYPLHSSLFGI